MSRIGRDHLQVGFFTDILFREKEVRFIAINNGIDSDRQETSEFAPFLKDVYKRQIPPPAIPRRWRGLPSTIWTTGASGSLRRKSGGTAAKPTEKVINQWI